MPINIFDTDPDAKKPRSAFADDIVGRFRSGTQVNRRPLALDEWRVTTGDPDVATAIRAQLGGDRPQEWDTQGEDNLEVFTKAAEVEVILDGPSAIRSGMVLWGHKGLIRACDGVTQRPTEDGRAGEPCACPSAFADRKAASKAGTGCDPSIQVVFRLADNPELGKFKFQTGSWTLVQDINEVEEKLAKIDGPASATLALEVVEYVAKATGEQRRFTKPVIRIHGPAARVD